MKASCTHGLRGRINFDDVTVILRQLFLSDVILRCHGDGEVLARGSKDADSHGAEWGIDADNTASYHEVIDAILQVYFVVAAEQWLSYKCTTKIT